MRRSTSACGAVPLGHLLPISSMLLTSAACSTVSNLPSSPASLLRLQASSTSRKPHSAPHRTPHYAPHSKPSSACRQPIPAYGALLLRMSKVLCGRHCCITWPLSCPSAIISGIAHCLTLLLRPWQANAAALEGHAKDRTASMRQSRARAAFRLLLSRSRSSCAYRRISIIGNASQHQHD